MPEKYIVLVDAYGTTSYLAPEFLQYGYQCIHVASVGAKADYLLKSFKPDDFAIKLQASDDINIVIQNLKSQGLDIRGVVPGVESAVIIADQIAFGLGLKQNDPKTSHHRRFKHEMANQLAANNIAHIPHLQSNDAQTIIQWADENNYWPIVIKPTNGAGTEGFSICQHQQDVRDALAKSTGQRSFLGHTYDQMLAQPYIGGEEYCIDTVSVKLASGEVTHRVVAVWHSLRTELDGSMICDQGVLLPSEGVIQNQIIAYMQLVLNALGMEKGPAHSEVKVTPQGPVLIEMNPRIVGLSIPPHKMREALAYTQVSATVDAFADVDKFLARTSQSYQLQKQLVCVIHQVQKENCAIDKTALTEFQALPTFALHKIADKNQVPKTTSLIDSVGWVLLIDADKEKIKQDIAGVRRLEEKLFVTQPQLKKQTQKEIASMQEKYVLIIDAVGTTSFIAQEFIERGYKCIHIDAGEKDPYVRGTLRRQDFEFEIKMDVNTTIDGLVDALSKQINGKIEVVTTGLESNLHIVDALAQRLGLQQNNPATTEDRRNKYNMAERLKQKGLNHIPHLKSNDAQEIVRWANENNHWPLALKPTNGAGTEGFAKCNIPAQVEEALMRMKQKVGLFGHAYDTALAQPFIDGDEYCVNMVSVVDPATNQVEHRLTDLWISRKISSGDSMICDNTQLLPSTGEQQDLMVAYMKQVLNALEVQNGPTHSELKLDKFGQPVLIEVNPRIMGLSMPPAIQFQALEYHQISAAADGYVDVKTFLARTANPYQLKNHIVCVLHQVLQKDCLININAVPYIEQLPTFARHKFNHTHGEAAAQTVDLTSSLGWVVLVSDDERKIQRDIARLREIEKTLLFMPRAQFEKLFSSGVNDVSHSTVNGARSVGVVTGMGDVATGPEWSAVLRK